MDVKKGLRNPLDAAQVRKAVLALQTFVAKQKAALPKTPLVENPEYVSAIITRKLIPAKGSNKPIQIVIPHSIRGGENDAEMCLIVKNGDKARIKAALAADPVPGLAKVIELKKLKKNFSRFDDKRTLAGAYDLFLADDRIVAYLPEALGTKFFVKKKQPVVVRVSRKDVSNAVRAVFQRTQMVVSTGACTNVKVAHLGLSVDAAVENVLVAMNNCAAHIPKGWHGVQSISLKTNESVALPIYNALATLAKLPPTSKKDALVKRKLEEVAALDDEVAVTKAKKAKVEAVAPAAMAPAAPAKKVEEAAPAKKASLSKKATPAKKEAPAKKAEAEKPTSAAPVPAAKKAAKVEKSAPAAPAPVTKKAKKAAKVEEAAPASAAAPVKEAKTVAPAAAPAKKAKKTKAEPAASAPAAKKAKVEPAATAKKTMAAKVESAAPAAKKKAKKTTK